MHVWSVAGFGIAKGSGLAKVQESLVSSCKVSHYDGLSRVKVAEQPKVLEMATIAFHH